MRHGSRWPAHSSYTFSWKYGRIKMQVMRPGARLVTPSGARPNNFEVMICLVTVSKNTVSPWPEVPRCLPRDPEELAEERWPAKPTRMTQIWRCKERQLGKHAMLLWDSCTPCSQTLSSLSFLSGLLDTGLFKPPAPPPPAQSPLFALHILLLLGF